MPTKATVLKELDTIVSSGAALPARKTDFASPKAFRESAEDIQGKLLQQKYEQRADILTYIENMAKASFIFLVVIVLGQMVIRVAKPNYIGVSDTVINTLTVGVFGQVIGIVASITIQVWKAPKDEGSNTTVPSK